MSLTKTPCEAKNIHNKVFYNEKMTSSICKSEDFHIKGVQFRICRSGFEV